MLSSCFLSLTLILPVFSPVGATQDFRHISYEDLVERSTLFNADGVTTYSQLLFDVARQQVVVGARDNLYRLTLDSLSPLEHATWPAPPEKASICQDKGQTSQDCHNYIKVLLSNGKSLFTCGTNAFSPQCTWREIENINTVTSWVSGVAMCPYSPDANVTALLARGNAGLFAGSSTDFSGADPAIYRTLASPILRTHQYDSRWLNDPQFVGSFETEDHVYFLFRESAVEYINCGKKIYSRIARVCKKDPGGQTLMRDTWTTFSKARLNCSLPGEFPFYYDEIQGAAYHPDEGIIYATFTTPSNGIAGSAICAFNMSAVASAFNGPFKHQEHSGAAWEKKRVTNRNRQHCGSTANSPPHQIMDNQRYQLMDDAVQSTSMMPLHTATLERFSHIAVDVTPTKLHRGLTVLYVATAAGLVKKISVLPRTQETCLVEVWGPLPSPAMTLQFLKDAMSLYIGMETGLLRIPAAQCHRHRNRQACLNAQEPYCGWNEHLMKCQTAPNDNHLANHWLQEVNKCPVLTDPVDGGWSAWSPWASCHHDTAEQTAGRSRFHPRFHMDNAPENSDSCQCQTRECNNPPAQNGGAGCNGAKVKVANCTVHGGWTAWSAWSACSQTCGLAMKTRRRSCTNPAPGFGGRVCVGHDHDEIVCIDLPPCSSPAKPPPPPQNGQWSPWGPWNSCSRPCNGGIRMRKRTCDKPSPREGGAECPGCEIQIGDCNVHPCTETKRFSGWTPWLAVNATALESTNSLYTEKRFRFTCRAQTDDPSSVRVQLAKEEERFCRNDGSCLRGNAPNNNNMNSEINIDGGGWSEWSSWLPCNQACGGGSQQRVRQCDSPPCEGMAMQTRICNTHSCPSSAGNGNGGNEWSCWTDWSECSVSCGIGIRTRTRDCLGNDECDGANIDRKSCEMPSCESFLGWDEWTRWSPPCDRAQQQHRKRQCLEPGTSGVCQGLNRQVRDCLPDWIENDVSSNALPRSVEMAGISIGAVIGGCIAGFFIGLALTALLCFFYLKRRKPLVPGSPHYISKQNPYVSVPLKEINSAKRQPSFSGSSNGNGTLRPKTNPNVNGLGSPKLYPKSLEYETATLKRNSHGQQQQQQQQQHIRADLDQDKYY